MLRVAVFGSGRGSNFQAILRAIDEGRLPETRICLVVSNNSTAGILETARDHALPVLHLSQKQFPGEDAYVDALVRALQESRTDLMVLAGYMKRLPSRIVAEYRNRILNVHPALLPKFGGAGMYGMRVHEAVCAAGEQASGATVHLVDEEYDHGPVVLQRTVPVLKEDTAETLAARVLEVEHAVLPEAIRLFAEHRITVTDGRVTVI